MKSIIRCIAIGVMVSLCGQTCLADQKREKQDLVNSIENNRFFDQVDSMGRAILTQGLNAGSGYSQVWVRDLNTFIEIACEEVPAQDLRGALLVFFGLQQPNGEIADGYVLKGQDNWGDPKKYLSKVAPDHVGFKNTVETDQETSLIQAVAKYIRKTGDTSILKEKVGGKTVYHRMKKMVDYLMQEKYDAKHGLIYGAMTADWGDVQPNDDEVVDINDNSIIAIDVYDNAMFAIALNDLAEIGEVKDRAKWLAMRKDIMDNTRKYLWDTKNNKIIPHIYLNKIPDLGDFDESKVYYHGGTAIAIEAGLLTKEEIAIVNKHMLDNVRLSAMPSIGLTVYPPYPDGFFHGGMSKAYVYQNGGDWTWFGGRMIQQLIANGYVAEAYDEVRPMIDRVLVNKGFFEWYGPGGVPSGSGHFKGSAGVLCKTIAMFKEWAKQNKQ